MHYNIDATEICFFFLRSVLGYYGKVTKHSYYYNQNVPLIKRVFGHDIRGDKNLPKLQNWA